MNKTCIHNLTVNLKINPYKLYNNQLEYILNLQMCRKNLSARLMEHNTDNSYHKIIKYLVATLHDEK